MTVPKLTKQDIYQALQYIDKNGVPAQNKSTRYDLVTDDGKKYPPKYLIAVADRLVNGEHVQSEEYNSISAKDFLKGLGFQIEDKSPEKFELTITADKIESTDDRFTVDNLSLGDNYKPLKVVFEDAQGNTTQRAYQKGERRNSNQTLPRLAFQLFEKQLIMLPDEEKEKFPVCRYKPETEMIKGIYSSVDSFIENCSNSIERLVYKYGNGQQFVIYAWNIFSTVYFVQECLKRFGKQGDKFVLTYREKEEAEIKSEPETPPAGKQETSSNTDNLQNPYSPVLLESKNLIFRGAPGTGKSYLAKQIAADIISNGKIENYSLLTDEQKEQIEFVQFHPSYDYSDFVEGLRPIINADGSTGFELQDGIFKKFADQARKNYEDSLKTKDVREKELSAQEALEEFFSTLEYGERKFQTKSGSEFTITSADDRHVKILIPENAVSGLTLNLDEIRLMLESGKKFEKVADVTKFFGKKFATQQFSYDFAIVNAIKEMKKTRTRTKAKQDGLKKYVFIIDEINRGEISKIFGELFFAVDPGYRGKAGEVATQYSSMHANPRDKFYIPPNVYIIGTMNDIDRSVDSFDFAMRRRFRFIELKADQHIEMLSALENENLRSEAIQRMKSLNREIASVEDLNENYQIGAAYFLKLNTLSFDQLWTDFLQPLLQEYVRGMYDEQGIMKRFARAYGYSGSAEDGNVSA